MANHRRKAPSKPVDVLARAEQELKARHRRMANHRADGLDAEEAEYGETPIDPARKALLEEKGYAINIDARGRVVNGRHVDIWEQLRQQKAIPLLHYNAIRELEALMIKREVRGAGLTLERCDRQGDAAAVTDAMLDAGAIVDDVLALVGPPLSRILQAMLGPNAQQGNWRDVVASITGAKNPQPQSGMLRLAAQTVFEVLPECQARAADRWNARKDRLEAAGNGHMRANAA